MSYKLGRLAPHPEETHPRVKLAAHLTGDVPVPSLVDWASKVQSWPMLMNDTLGDCTAAGALHMFQAMTAYASSEFTPDDAQALSLYEAVSGYDPQTGQNDNGAVEQDVLQYLTDTGAAGHKVTAYAQVDHLSRAEMKDALNLFGTLYVGIECPDSMQQQFAAGQVIDYVPGATVEGGHCVVVQEWDADYLYIVTWGKLVKMTWDFWTAYGEEAWAVVTPDWIEAGGSSPSGLDLQALLSEFREITGGVAPAVQASPAPGVFERFLNWLRSVL